MNAQTLKEKIIQDDKVIEILEALDCHHIKKGKTFYTAANPDGDRPTAINVGIESLHVTNHTRSDYPNSNKSDIITLVEYMKDLYFTQAIKWICDACGFAYYDNDREVEKIIDPCVLVLEQIEPKNKEQDDVPLKRLPDIILNEFVQYPHIKFLEEDITYEVQKMFEIGFSVRDEGITIPIRDELGNLVGVKCRTTLDYEKLNTSKYWFPYPTPKTLILYGLDKSLPYIKEAGEVIVYEAEKSVQKSFSYGFCHCVSIGGHQLSETQVLKLEKLGVKITLAFDKTIDKDTGKDITATLTKKEAEKFLLKDKIYAIMAYKNRELFEDKDAPVDRGIENFIKLYNEDMYKIYK